MCGTMFSCSELLLQILVIGLTNGAVIALNAVGVTLVYGAVRMINFAHGDVFALASVAVTYSIGYLGLQRGASPWLIAGGLAVALACGVLLGGALNLFIERAAFRPFRGRSRLAPLIASVGLSFVLYEGALLLRKTQADWIPQEHRSVPGVPELPRTRIPELLGDYNVVAQLGITSPLIITLKDVLVVVAAFALTGAVAWWLKRSRMGRALRACAQDPELAELCGVNRTRTIQVAFVVGGVLAGAAAWVFAIFYDRPFGQHGAQSGLIALTAAVMGGIGQPWGALGSGLVLGVAAALSDWLLAAQWTPVLVLGLLVVLLWLRPVGLLGSDPADEQATSAVAVVTRRLGTRRHRWGVWAFLALGLLYPVLDYVFAWRSQVLGLNVLLLVVLALGLNLLLGLAGQLDLGYAASFAVGAYTTAMLTSPNVVRSPWITHNFPLVLLLSGAVTACFGLLLGGLSRRLRGDYLALVTLVVGQILVGVLRNLRSWTGGDGGIAALPPPRLGDWTLGTITARYYLVLAVVAVIVLLSVRLTRSRIGRAWAALSADETAAASCGVNAARGKTLAFVLSSAVAGVGGGLFAMVFSYVYPQQSDFALSALLLAMVIIGGSGDVLGVIVGATLVASYDRVFIPLLGAAVERWAVATETPALRALDVRTFSVGLFGLVLYLTIRLRARTNDGAAPAPPRPALRPVAAVGGRSRWHADDD